QGGCQPGRKNRAINSLKTCRLRVREIRTHLKLKQIPTVEVEMRGVSIRSAVDFNSRRRRPTLEANPQSLSEFFSPELGVVKWQLYDAQHGRMRRDTRQPGACRQQERTNRHLREISEGASGPRRAPMARRARAAHLRERLRAGVEDVGRADEDDSQRVSPDAVAERGAGADLEAHGGFLLRPGRGAAAGIRAAADEIMGRLKAAPTYGS